MKGICAMPTPVENFLTVLPLVGYGLIGVFGVTAIIILFVTLLNRITAPKKKDENK